MKSLNVLLCSAGRRPYLVEWFRRAVASPTTKGKVIVADSDPYAASRNSADAFVMAPRFDSPEYLPWVADIVGQYDIGLALSLNDRELSLWATSDLNSRLPCHVLHLSHENQLIVEDKLAMFHLLERNGIRSPFTATGTQALSGDAPPEGWSDELIVKHRYGSGSVGLRTCSFDELDDVITTCASTALDNSGARIVGVADQLDAIVVQPRIPGDEFGVDIVNDLEGAFATVLSRRKLAMRNGETDSATTSPGTEWSALAQRLSHAVSHRGIMDTDVIRDVSGECWVIDLNPRFGGGYPFSHLADADIPAAYVAWALDRDARPEWLRSREGVTSSKHIALASVRVP